MIERFAWLALIAGASACSFAAVRAPHIATAETELDCETIKPTLDAVGAVIALGAMGAAAYAGATARSSPDAMGAAFVGVPAGVAGVTYAASGIYGAITLRRCRRLEREQRAVHGSDAATHGTRARVQALIDEAARDAREGRCDRAVSIAREVRTLYPDYYTLVRDDAAIARCLD